MNALTFLLVLVSVSLNAFAQLALRKAVLTMGPMPPLTEPIRLGLAVGANPWFWVGMVNYGLSLGLWLAVLSRLQVSVAYPMLSIGYVIAAFIGVFWLGESVSLARAGGIALICIGVFVVSRTA